MSVVRQALVSLVVVCVVHALLASGAFECITERIRQYTVQATLRILPDGLVSIGALLVIRDFCKDRIKNAVSYVKTTVSSWYG